MSAAAIVIILRPRPPVANEAVEYDATAYGPDVQQLEEAYGELGEILKAP